MRTSIFVRLRRVIFENFFLKVVSLIIAVALFVYVKSEKTQTESIDVPVVYVNEPYDRVLVSERLDKVSLRVTGPWTPFFSLEPGSIDPLTIDLGGGKSGPHYFDRSKFRLPNALMKVEEVLPPSVELRFEPVDESLVPVVVEAMGTPSLGFVTDERRATPPDVAVRGARSAVEGLMAVRTLPVSVEGLSEKLTTKVRLRDPPAHVRFRLDPPEVAVEITFREVAIKRWIPEVPIEAQGLGAKLVATVDPEKVSALLEGPNSLMERSDLSGLRIIIDCAASGIAVAGEYSVKLTPEMLKGLPDSGAIQTKKYDRETILVVVKPVKKPGPSEDDVIEGP